MRRLITLALLAAYTMDCQSSGVDMLQARAWQPGSQASAYDFPELERPEIRAKSSSGIAFTGGGARAMVAAFGQLAALRALGLLPRVRYITGISGGSWATHAFSYYQPGAPGVAMNDDEFLCLPLTHPANLTRSALGRLRSTCARRLATLQGENDSLTDRVKAFEASAAALWTASVIDTAVAGLWSRVLAPLGVPLHAPFSWDRQTVDEIRQRNPVLNGTKFVLPSGADHPFPIVGFALMGPAKLAPFKRSGRARKYSMLEVPPSLACAA